MALEIIALIKEDMKINPALLTKTEEVIEVILEKEEQVETLVEDNNIKQNEEQKETLAADENIEQNEEPMVVEIVQAPATVQVSETLDSMHFTFSASFSPFLTTGEATSYFTLGMFPDIYAGYCFFTSYGYFSLGLTTSLNYFKAEGILLPSDNLLISLGPEIRLGFDANSFPDMFLRFTGGASLFMMNRNNEGYKNTIIPFISGGPGINLNITRSFGIVITTNYSLYFETSVLITGFSPSAGVYLRL